MALAGRLRLARLGLLRSWLRLRPAAPACSRIKYATGTLWRRLQAVFGEPRGGTRVDHVFFHQLLTAPNLFLFSTNYQNATRSAKLQSGLWESGSATVPLKLTGQMVRWAVDGGPDLPKSKWAIKEFSNTKKSQPVATVQTMLNNWGQFRHENSIYHWLIAKNRDGGR